MYNVIVRTPHALHKGGKGSNFSKFMKIRGGLKIFTRKGGGGRVRQDKMGLFSRYEGVTILLIGIIMILIALIVITV